MKKIFVCLLSVAAIAACQKNQVLETVVGPEIAFENASVDYQTRAAVDPSTTTANISEFSVWGYMDERNGAIFNEELVSRSGSAWTYANTQYWLAGHTYYFAAVSPVKAANVVVTPETATTAGDYGLGKIDFTNTDGSTDLIYASAMVEAAAGADLSAMPKVGLSFSHLLSKVKFTFTNGFENPNTTLKITGLTMTAPQSGTIDLNVENWWDNTDDWQPSAENVTLAFGDVNKGEALESTKSYECDNERLTIPAGQDQVYTVKFHVQMWNGDVLAVENDIETKVEGAILDMGKAYNFKAEINASNIMGPDAELYPIEFEVEVKEWEEAGDVTTELKKVEVAAGQSYTLVTDAVATTTVKVAGTFDGAGHTVAVEEGTADFLASSMLQFIQLNGEDVTLRNVVVDGNNATYDVTTDDKDPYGIRNIVITGAGKYLIDNVQSINATYPIHVSTTAEVTLDVVNSTLQGWTSYNPGTTANFQNVKFVKGNYAMFRPYGTTVLTNCAFDADFVIDLGSLKDGETIKFVNCTYAGAALTAANLTGAEGKTVTIE